ncbi:MAG: type I 3-dehydroquinate dehydratase [Bacteroidales bacterium]|jgi:3-phosphoshikimate 1-carboxyvinyltransferase|nr:type I 3-dehydroquinate dehydratase [Bacteroidales bacterium]MCI2144870.1 type I 3-dehydroquinate dehydratase [Bacteroidales bacterium]
MKKLCYSILGMQPEYCEYVVTYLSDCFVELRLDTTNFSRAALRRLLARKRSNKVIVACPHALHHNNRVHNDTAAGDMLGYAIDFGADYIDIAEYQSKETRLGLIKKAREKGCGIIVSEHHNAPDEPKIDTLVRRVKRYYSEGADIVKIVLGGPHAAENMHTLYRKFADRPGQLISFVLDSSSSETRWESLELGAPFTYVALGKCILKAPGEITYFDTLDKKEIKVDGTVGLPSSKSITQRAIILAALCEGKSVLQNVTLCDDTVNAINIAISIGAKATYNEGQLEIEGAGIRDADSIRVPADGFYHVGESGFLARVCVALAAVSGKGAIILGERTLLHRKFGKEFSALKAIGIDVELSRKEFLPAQVSGTIDTTLINLSGVSGSQLISGLMMALPLFDRDTKMQIINAASVNYLYLTRSVMKSFGMHFRMQDDIDKRRASISIKGKRHYTPATLKIEKDWSAASMMLAAGFLAGQITVKDLPLDSDQPDSVFFTLLFNCAIDMDINEKIVDGKHYMDLTVKRDFMLPFEADITDMPDMFPALFILSLRCAGTSVITGISRLRNKESDRAASFYKEFTKLDVKIRMDGEKMEITGAPDMTIGGGQVSSHGDHRLAMALLVASLISRDKIEIDNLECLSKSYPDFRKELAAVITDKTFELPE